MYNRRILINEDDRGRILNMHENHAKRNNLNFGRLNETEVYEEDKGNQTTNSNLETLLPTLSFYLKVNGQEQAPSKFNTIQDLETAVTNKQVTLDTNVWNPETKQKIALNKTPGLETIVEKIDQLAPDAAAPAAKTYRVNKTGQASEQTVNMTIEQLAKDSSYKYYVDPKENRFKAIEGSTLGDEITNARGPQSVAQQVQSTRNQAVDTWLQTPEGIYFKTKTTPQAKEAFIDYLETTGAGIIAKAGGKELLRKVLLGPISADTKLGRFGQKIKQGVQGAVQGFQGQQQA